MVEALSPTILGYFLTACISNPFFTNHTLTHHWCVSSELDLTRSYQEAFREMAREDPHVVSPRVFPTIALSDAQTGL